MIEKAGVIKIPYPIPPITLPVTDKAINKYSSSI